MAWLPGMEGRERVVEEVVKRAGDAPLYVVMVRNPNQFGKSSCREMMGLRALTLM